MLLKYVHRFSRAVKNTKIRSILLIIGYLLGLILGLFLKGNNQENLFYEFVINYYNLIFGLYSSPIKLLLTRPVNNLFSFPRLYHLLLIS